MKCVHVQVWHCDGAVGGDDHTLMKQGHILPCVKH